MRIGWVTLHPNRHQTMVLRELNELQKGEVRVLYLDAAVNKSWHDVQSNQIVDLGELAPEGIHCTWMPDDLVRPDFVVERLARTLKLRPKPLGSPLPRRGYQRKVRSWLIDQGIDVAVIHGFSDLRMLSTVRALKNVHTPYVFRGTSNVMEERGSIRRVLQRTIAKKVIQGSSCVVYIGTNNRRYYDELGVTVPLEESPYSAGYPASPEERSDLDARRERRSTHFGFVGKLQSWKRPADVITAFMGIDDPDSRLTLVGSGPLEASLRSMAAADQRIFFTGYLDSAGVMDQLDSFDVLVLPSSIETWGLVINEGMMRGCIPIVSSTVGCAPDLVDGVGYIIPVGDVEALTEGMKTLQNHEERAKRRQLVWERIERYTPRASAIGIREAGRTAIEHHQS